MVALDKRLRKLEEYQADVAPEPTPVYFEGDPRIDAAGGKCVVIVMTRCARKCTDNCTERGGHSCRDTQEVIS